MDLYVVFNALTERVISPAMCLWSAEQWEDDWHDQNGWSVPLEIRHA